MSKKTKKNDKKNDKKPFNRNYTFVMSACLLVGYFLSLGTVLYIGYKDPYHLQIMEPEKKRKLFKPIWNIITGKRPIFS